MGLIDRIPTLTGLQLTRIKFVLLMAFSLLLLLQALIGFQSFEDYLIGLVYILFLNDLYIKIKRTDLTHFNNERMKRSVMSVFFLVLFLMTFLLDELNVTNAVRLYIYKLGFMLWAQIFLLDAFINYRQTQQKSWLIITNMAVLLIVFGAFAV
ncbi:MAG: hypothetical protein HOP07_00440 [Bacteriovoracaceae bacterium]|nr:hypothetical protein [Bacteriovoracaceae bacterium]